VDSDSFAGSGCPLRQYVLAHNMPAIRNNRDVRRDAIKPRRAPRSVVTANKEIFARLGVSLNERPGASTIAVVLLPETAVCRTKASEAE